MLARALLAVPLLLCPGLLLSQAEPRPARPMTHNPSLQPAGAVRVSDLAIQRTSPTNDFVAMCYQQSLSGPRMLGAFDRSRTGGQLMARTDFSSVTAVTEEISITPDLSTIAILEVGVGPRFLQRSSLTSAFGAPTQGNLANDCYGMQFYRSAGVVRLAAARTLPSPHIETYDFDQNQLTVSNAVILTPPLGGAGNFVAFLMILADENGEARGIIACIRQPVGFQQQFVFCASMDNIAPWQVLYTSTTNDSFTGGDQLTGGHCVVTKFGFGPLPNGPIDLVGTFMFATFTSIQGGWTDATMMGPPGDLGLIGFGTGVVPGVAIPGIDNLLALAGLFLAATAAMPGGVGQLDFNLGPSASSFVLFMQGVSWSLAAFPNMASNTAGFYAM